MEPAITSSRGFASAAHRAWLALSLLGLAGGLLLTASLLIGWAEVKAGVAHSYQVCLAVVRHDLVPPVWLVSLTAAGMMVSILAAGVSVCWDALRTWRLVRRLRPAGPTRRPVAAGAGLRGQIVAVDDEAPFAITAGLLRPQVFVSSGLLAALEDREIEAVLEHESFHIRQRDPVRRLVGRAARRALFFLPSVHDLWDRYHAAAELAADAAAVTAVGRDAVARALLKIVDSPSKATAPGVASGFATMLDLRATYLLAPQTGVRLPPIARSRLTASAAIPVVLIGAMPWLNPPTFVDIFAHLIGVCR